MVGGPRIHCCIAAAKKKRTIVVGLKSHNCSREMLLRLLTMVVCNGDNVLAVHVQEPNDTFDPNTFHIHEDICKSKQVDFQVKVCTGESIAVLTHQVRLHFATMLVLGCNTQRPKESLLVSCLKGLPPTCSLLVMDNGGKILFQQPGTSQQGSTSQVLQSSSMSSLPAHTSSINHSEPSHHLPKPTSKWTSSKSSSLKHADIGAHNSRNGIQSPETMGQNQLQRMEELEVQSASKPFTLQELIFATNNLNPQMVIGEGGHGQVHRSHLGDGQATAVKPSKIIQRSGEEVLQEVEMLRGLNHEHKVEWVKPNHHSPKPTSNWTSSESSSLRHANIGAHNSKTRIQSPETMGKLQLKLAVLEARNAVKRFTLQELCCATHNFSSQMVIGEGGRGKVYRACLGDGQAAAVKALKNTQRSGEELLQEVEMLSGLNHEHIVQLIGFCYDKEVHAVVYNLLQGSLKQKLRQLGWSDRARVAVGLAKALEYLHHSCSPPIIHSDVKSSNILLSQHCQPLLSDFGAAMLRSKPQQPSPNKKPLHLVGTIGQLAPESMMYGKVDEKTDVYSFGVVLLELITGKEAIETNQTSNHESLVLRARSLLSSGQYERLIDPYLNGDYDKEAVKRMMIAARLCLMHSSSRRPSMKAQILKLLEGPEYWLKMQREREEFINGISSKGESKLWRLHTL